MHEEPRNAGYSFDGSWHYRVLLMLAALLSTAAATRAAFGLFGQEPWGPPWLNVAILAQIIIGWVILVRAGVLTDSNSLLLFGLIPVPVAIIELSDRDFDIDLWLMVATSGLLPAVALFSFVTCMNPYGVLAAVVAATALLALVTALIWRGSYLGKRAYRAAHPVRQLLAWQPTA